MARRANQQGISIREAARRLNALGGDYEITEGGIRKWIKAGLFHLLPDGSVDPNTLKAQAEHARRNVDPFHGGNRKPDRAPPSPERQALESVPVAQPGRDEDDVVLDFEARKAKSGGKGYGEIRAAREAVNFHRDKLRLGAESQELVERVKVQRALADLGALTREIMERIPDKVPFALSREDRIALRSVVLESLAELAEEAGRVDKAIVEAA